MNLRRLAVLLLVCNLGFFAWTQTSFDGGVGVSLSGGREPERLARQFQPQSVRIVPPGEAASAMAATAASPTSCLEAGPYTPAEADVAEAALQAALPAGSWVRRETRQPEVWMVYLGRFIAADALQKATDELKRLQAPFEEVQSPPELAPGVSLGRFDNRAAADTALEQWAERGVRAARVVTLAEPATTLSLRVEHADTVLAGQVAALDAMVKGQPLGKAFLPCGG